MGSVVFIINNFNTMQKDLVSIILPVFNVEDYIEKSINSILRQTYEKFELLVINDGTKDNSIKIVRKFKDSRIKIFNKENGGLSDARNYGLKRAIGEYVYFMDSDDWIESKLIENCLAGIKKYKSDFIVFGYYLDKQNLEGRLLSSQEVIHNEIVFKKNKNNLSFGNHTFNLMGYAWNKLYKNSFLKKKDLRFETGVSLVEDIIFNSEVYKNSNKIVFLRQPLYHYIDRPVTTLIKKFHENSFELKVRKNLAVNEFLTAWEINNVRKNIVLSESIVSGIRYCVNNLFAVKNKLSAKEKIAYMKMMLNHDETRKYIQFYPPKSIIDRIYKKIILQKATLPLYFLCKIMK